MNEKEILKEEKDFFIPDDVDRRIMQALSDELSQVTVNKELFERTLSAAQKQREERNEKKRRKKYHIAGGVFTAAAALLVIVLCAELVHNGRMSEGNFDNLKNNVSGSAGYEPNMDADWPFSSKVQESKGESSSDGTAGSAWDAMDVADDCADGSLQEAQQAEDWMYYEILAAFNSLGVASADKDAVLDANGGLEEDVLAQEVDGAAAETPFPGEMNDLGAESSLQEKTEEEKEEPSLLEEAGKETRSIVWEQDGKKLLCVIYEEDYRIVATLWENGVMRRIELKDWRYALQLWEMAME